MVTALYRRYRPETFAELIGQSQVTDPLRTALRTDRVNHAYLFSGPRGCGKTTSARILARCLNCAEGPTDTPCGVCASCLELARDGSGSLDVVEIDAASHNGVDDARDLRERAAFAPARDRYKIFILDEAHMVTPQGFNALLKLVEEPPDHVKFIFATTEPEKVIGTIRSRTHHYPFRLVPPAQMLDYVQQLSEAEKVSVQPGVLPLVVRAGGGSVRDTLSLLDQLIAGSEGSTESSGGTVEYERAVALLGYTHAALLDEVVDALGAMDAAAAFSAVDRVIQTGQDPRRFVEDLLERLRDLIVVAATRDGAAAVLRGIPHDELDRMSVQAVAFGAAELSRAADVVNSSLTEMTGATSPRLHLELMVARLLVPASDDTDRGALARVERLERRVGIADSASAVAEAPAVRQPATKAPIEPPARPAQEPNAAASDPTTKTVVGAGAAAEARSGLLPEAKPAPVTLAQLRDSWPEILEVVQKAKRTAWMVVYTSTPRALNDDVLTLSFPSETDVSNFKERPTSGDSVSEQLRTAISTVLGIRVRFVPRVDAAAGAPGPVAAETPGPTAEPVAEPVGEPANGGWNVTAIPGSEAAALAAAADQADEEPAASDSQAKSAANEPSASGGATAPTAQRDAQPSAARARYGEAVVRELLGANFIEEQDLAPRDRPVTLEPASESAGQPGASVQESAE
ncbi:MAG TPA: DNA polymerase III subunit gamma and tau [Pseudolysinimonas sp.]|nr:DNA polymerase III subunit gamma and tau [Pseudolysinimonas sp.]